jgi:two-component system, sensor histidine kinase YesM
MERVWSRIFSQLAYRHEQWSLQKRLILTYIIVMLVPSLLISYYIFNQFSDNYISEVRSKNEYAVELELGNIEGNINTMMRTAQITDSDSEVRNYLAAVSEPSTTELLFDVSWGLVRDKLTQLMNYNPDIAHLRIYSDNPFVSEIFDVFYRSSRVREEPWFPVMQGKAGTEYYWHVSPNDDSIIKKEDRVPKPKLMLLRNIEYPAGKVVGMLEVDMWLENFFPKSYSQLDGEQAQMAVIDRAGRVYYNRSNPWLADSGVTDEMLQSVVDRQSRERLVSVDFRADGTPMLATYTYIEQLDIHMVQVVSLEQTLRELMLTRNKLIAANIILLIILSVVSYFLNALILKRLHILRDSMKKMRQGDFSFEIPVRGGGEVGELAHHFRKMLSKINELIADAVNKKAASKEAELRSLKNQIDSHFLYNTLENIKMMAEVDGRYAISDALTSLGGLLRYNLKWTSEYVRLRDEIAHIANYIAIMNVRFERKVELATAIEPGYLAQELLKMSLQPIVENAVKHGFREGESGDMRIEIEAWREEGVMVIAITDNGEGMNADALKALNRKLAADPSNRAFEAGDTTDAIEREGSGIGLQNVQQRIRLFYGHEYGLQVESEEGSHTRVLMRIPYFILSGGAG